MQLYVVTAAALAAQFCLSFDLGAASAWLLSTGAVAACWRVFVAGSRLGTLIGPAGVGALVGAAALLADHARPAPPLSQLLDDHGRSSVSYDLVADVVEPPKLAAHGTSAVVAVRRLVSPAGAVSATEGLMLVSVRHASGRLRFGNAVRLRTRLRGVTNLGNPGEFDFAAWCARRGIAVSGFVWDDREIEDLGPSATIGLITRWRAQIGTAAADGRGAGGALTASLVVGDRSRLEPGVLTALRVSGLFHLLAISGMNIAVVAGFAVWAAGVVVAGAGVRASGHDPYRPAAAVAALTVIVYAMLSGGGDSVARATIMGLLMLVALWRGRHGDGVRGLALAALALSVVSPGGILDAGFQLTFVATAAVLVAAGLVARFTWPRGLSAPVAAVTIALLCWLVTAPVLAYHFHRVSLPAPVAGLFAGPPAGVVVVAGLIGSVLLPVSEALAGIAFDVAGWAGDAVLWVARVTASFDWAEVPVVSPGAPVACAITAAPLILLAPRNLRCRLALALALAISGFGARAVFERYRADRLDAVFASVGQGDAGILRLPGGRVLVVDAGPPGRGRTVVGPMLRRMHIGRIDYFVVTHAQDDHWGGLADLAEEFEIGELWHPGGACRGPFVELLMRIERRGTRIVEVGRALDGARRGRRALVRRGTEGWRLRALWPRSPAGSCEDNDRSVVVEAVFAGRRILLTGDIEALAERELARLHRRGAFLLKVPHHGSRTSSTAAFLAAVRPAVAVASLGWANRFRFPHPEVVARYERNGVRLFRTDVDGAVRATITRRGLSIEGARKGSGRFTRAGLRQHVD